MKDVKDMISKGNVTDLLYVSISYLRTDMALSHAHVTFIKISYDRPGENVHVIIGSKLTDDIPDKLSRKEY